MLSCYIQVEPLALISLLWISEAMVQITVDPNAPSYFHVILMGLDKFVILEVTLPPLIIPTMSILSRVLKEVSRISYTLMDLATIALLASTLGSMPAVSTPLFLSTSASSLIALPLLPSTTPPTAIKRFIYCVPLCKFPC